MNARTESKKTVNVKVISLYGNRLEALNRLMSANFASWRKSRELVRLYQSVIRELEAFEAAITKLREDFPEAQGEEYERRVSVLDAAEVEIGVIELCETDFLDPKDAPTPADMILLGDIVDFE